MDTPMNSDSACEYLLDLEYDILIDILDNWRANKHKPNARQSWTVIPAKFLQSEYNYNRATGLVHDHAIDKLQSMIINCYLHLYVNTILMGHTRIDPIEYIANFTEDEITEDDLEKFADYAIDERGQWRLSDCGLDKIGAYAIKLLTEDDYNKKLVWIDCILNVAHQRGDLAAMFVEGGSHTLNRLSCA